MKKTLIPLLLAALLMRVGGALADVYNLDFESWPPNTAGIPIQHDEYVNGWLMHDAMCSTYYGARSGTKAVWLCTDTTTAPYTNSYLQSVRMNNGIGRLIFYAKPFNSSSLGYRILTSPNGTTWTTFTNLTATGSTWQRVEVNLDINDPVYFRIHKTQLTTSFMLIGLDDLSTTEARAKVFFSEVGTDPDTPEVNDDVTVSGRLTPTILASNVAATLYYAVGAAPTYTAVPMTKDAGNLWTADSPIPGQGAGITVRYYIQVTFQGPDAMSPAYYPAGGAGAPATYTIRQRDFFSAYKYMDLVGTQGTNMALINDQLWRGVLEVPAPAAGAGFRFRGIKTGLAVTNFWGDDAVDGAALPLFDTAVAGDAAFTLATLPAGQVQFRFHESNLTYSVRQAVYQGFDDWAGAETYGSHGFAGWQTGNARILVPADDSQKLRGRTCFLGTNTGGWVRSARLPEGIGEISFWYRNASPAGLPHTDCAVQVSPTGGTDPAEWTTIGTITAIGTTNYNEHTVAFNSRYHQYVRIRNSLTPGASALCVDEVTVLYAGAGVVISNLTHTPASPTAFETVSLSADVLPRAGATNLAVTAYFRSGSSGGFTPVPMARGAGDRWTTVAPIPAGFGNLPGGAGLVQYYIACTFSGFEAALASPTASPYGGASAPASYTVQSARVAFSDVTLSPDPQVVGNNVHVAATVAQLAGANNLSVSVRYRYGFSGSFATAPMEATGGPDRYQTVLGIPAQTVPGTPVQYYLYATFAGPAPQSPTNYPASGYLLFPFRARPPESLFDTVTVTAPFNRGLDLIDDGLWHGVGTLAAPVLNPNFRFAADSGSVTYFGDNNQLFTTLPVFGLVEAAGSPIQINGSVSSNLVFRFDEDSLEYSAQRAAYAGFDDWNGISSAYGTYTNAAGWVAGNARTTTTAESARAWRGGRSLVLNKTGGLQYLRSPYLPNGIGEISFRYRNWWMTNEFYATSVTIEKSITGAGNWVTVGTITNVLSQDYLHHSMFLSDLDYHYVRIANQAAGTHERLLLDEVVVSDAGPGVVFSNLLHSPAQPSIVDQVSVSVQIAPRANASDVQPTLWYRFGTAGVFNAIQMTNTTGNAYVSAQRIPRGDVGAVQYYVSCSFVGMVTTPRVTAVFPAGAPQATAAYTNSEAFGAFHDFEAWPATPYGIPVNVAETNNGFILHHAQVSTYYGASSGTKAAWLPSDTLAGTGNTNSYLQTPLVAHGVGSLNFRAKCLNAATLPIRIWISSDGVNWTVYTNLTCTSQTLWEEKHLSFDSLTPLAFRISKPTVTSGFIMLGLDDVRVTYPPARVRFSQLVLSPGYPSVDTPVNVSCRVVPDEGLFAPVGITARVRYRRLGETTYSGPVEMAGSPTGGVFTTVGGIPVQAAGTTVEFYVESTFQGYRYFARESHSPAFYPAGRPNLSTTQFYLPPLTNFTYRVREFDSSFESVATAVSNQLVTMRMTADGQWESILRVPQVAGDPRFRLLGFGRDTGNGLSPATNQWGDSYFARVQLPYSGTMQADGSNIVMRGVTPGQYVFRFNEETLDYTVQRCVFQDFDIWPASSDFFEQSISQADIIEIPQSFNTWPTNAFTVYGEAFDSWPLIDNYHAGACDSGMVGWIMFDSRVISQMTASAAIDYKACQFIETASPPLGHVRPNEFTLTDGIGTFSFDYRCRDDDGPRLTQTYGPTTWNNTMAQATLRATARPSNAAGTIMDPCWLSMYVRYQNADNYYELRVQQVTTSVKRLRLYRVRYGTRTLLWESGTGASIEEQETLRLIASTYTSGSGPRTYLQVYRNATWVADYRDSDANAITTPGTLSFSAWHADMSVDDVYSGCAEFVTFQDWPTVNGPDITHTRDGWSLRHGEYISGNNWVRLDTNRSTYAEEPYFRSPLLKHGAGVIRLYYRKENDNGDAPSRLKLQWSTNQVAWTTFKTILVSDRSNHTDTLTDVEVPVANVYVQICNDATIGRCSRVILDNIAIHPSPTVADSWGFAANANGWTDASGKWYVNGGLYRVNGYANDPLTFKVQTAAYADRNLLWDEGKWTTWATVTGRANLGYASYSIPMHTSERLFVRVKHDGGYGSFVVDNLAVQDWHGRTETWEGWRGQATWITTQNARTGNCLEMRRSRAYGSEEQCIMSPLMTNGVGTISFRYRSLDGTLVVLKVQRSPFAAGPWQDETVVSTTSTSWETPANYLAWSISSSAQQYVRILNTTPTADASVLVDDIRVSDYAERDEETWEGYNALITPNQASRLLPQDGNIKGAYLNRNAYDQIIDPLDPFTDSNPYIQSAFLSNGVGEISFWYRSWSTSEEPTIFIDVAPTAETPAATWTRLTSIPSIRNQTFRQFTFSTYDTSNHYVRIYCSTTSQGRVCLDNVLVTEPMGAAVVLGNLRTVPPVPLFSDAVHIEADIVDRFLNPSNIALKAYFHVGASPWDTWSEQDTRTMVPVATNGPVVTYRTSTPIPAQPTDTVVQYHVRATFTGRYSEYTSPNIYKTFTNPSWYHPVNLNSGQPATTPYYIVFNCLPGAVWINELNVVDAFFGTPYGQYVELAGPAGVDVRNWKLQVVNPSFVKLAVYPVTNHTVFADETATGYGFWLLATNSIAQRDQTLTNTVPQSAGLRLVRSMGAYEHGVCFGDSINARNMANNAAERFRWIGYDEPFLLDSGLGASGTGTNAATFLTWDNAAGWTPGAINAGQALPPSTNGPPEPPPVEILVTGFWLTPSQVWMVYTGTNTVTPTTWYSSDLKTTNVWQQVTGVNYTYGSGVYTQWFARPVTGRKYIYKVRGN